MNTRKVHFVGIGGIGMSALAQLLVERGDQVSGSDRDVSPVTDLLEKKGIHVLLGQKAENVPTDAALVVYSDAVPADNPERARAEELGIPQQSYFEVLGSVSEERRTVAVAGTHGKTTTTGMLARILRDAAVSPTAVVGSLVQDFGSNYLSGTSDIFVVEACEYKRHFLNLSPEVLVVTNLEFDHSDYFKDLTDVQDAFRTLMKKVPAHGTIVTDLENPNIQPLLEGLEPVIVDYRSLPAYELRLPGAFNQMNARAAAAAARVVLPGLEEKQIRDSLRDFHGTWRRFEYKGKTAAGATLYDDYAHHPTAIEETLRGLKVKEPNKRIVIAFHPHLYSRTRDLLDGFSRAFKDADEVVIAPIYAAREIDDGTVSSELLAERIRENGTEAHAYASLEEVQHVLEKVGEDAVIMTMGAGDIYKVADALVTK